MSIHLFFAIKDSNFGGKKHDVTRQVYEKYPGACFYERLTEIFDNGSNYFLNKPMENVIYVIGEQTKESEMKRDIVLVLRRYGINFEIQSFVSSVKDV